MRNVLFEQKLSETGSLEVGGEFSEFGEENSSLRVEEREGFEEIGDDALVFTVRFFGSQKRRNDVALENVG